VTGLLLALLAAPSNLDPCELIEPLDQENPELAAAYVEVGESELAAGAKDTAIAAFQEALRHQDDEERAQVPLDKLCEEKRTREALERGTHALQARRYRDAVEPLARAYRGQPASSTALMLALAHVELGEDEKARPWLELALQDPTLRNDASFYLGLIAYRHGRPSDAAQLFQTASADPRLRTSASQLLSLARQEGPVTLSLLGQTLYDTNPTLAPDGLPDTTVSGDTAFGALALGRLNFPGGQGPYLRLGGEYRQQLTLRAYDQAAVGGGAGLSFAGEHASFVAEYAYDFLALGGTPYLSAHRLLGWLRATGGGLYGELSYATRMEQVLPVNVTDYSGQRHWAWFGAGWAPSSRLSLGPAYQGARLTARVPELSFTEHGPLVELRGRPFLPLRLVAQVGLLFRGYDAVDPDLGLIRSDVYLDAEGTAELSLWDRWTLQLSVTGRTAFSNVPRLRYTKLTTALRLSYALGLP
jgi:Tfp pilus assembly protein PilF